MKSNFLSSGAAVRVGMHQVIIAIMFTYAWANGDDGMNALVADYHSYGLPQSSNQSELVILKRSNSTVNGIPLYEQVLVLLESANSKGVPQYWFAGRLFDLPRDMSVAPAKPLASVVADSVPEKPSQNRSKFETDPDLILAVQCAERGWIELAAALLERSRRPPPYTSMREKIRPHNNRAALAAQAWNYWCEEFCRETGDRTKILERLSELCQRAPGLDSPAHRNILHDMKQTLAAPKSPPDSVEEIVDSLVDAGIHGDRDGDLSSLYYIYKNEAYQKLESMGLEAVPVLLNHTHDFRLTRCVESNHRGTWIVRIADVVHHFLNSLAGQEFAHDILVREGRGRCVDRDHVTFWWSETKGIDVVTFLRDKAITWDDEGVLEANAFLLELLARRYPSELVTLFKKYVAQMKYADPLFEAIAIANISEQEKAELFLGEIQSQNMQTRESAIEQLLKISHEQAVPLLVAELDRLPKTPSEAYWSSDAGRVAQLLFSTDAELAWSTLARTAKRVDMGQRLEIIKTIGRVREKSKARAIAFLVQFLNDDETRILKRQSELEDEKNAEEMLAAELFSGPSAGFQFHQLSVRDFATLQLANLLGVEGNADAIWNESDWSSLRLLVSKALEGNSP